MRQCVFQGNLARARNWSPWQSTLAARDGGNDGIEQSEEPAQDARLPLAALAEEYDVMSREDRVLDLGDDRVVVPDDAGQERLAGGELAEEVPAHLSPAIIANHKKEREAGEHH